MADEIRIRIGGNEVMKLYKLKMEVLMYLRGEREGREKIGGTLKKKKSIFKI